MTAETSSLLQKTDGRGPGDDQSAAADPLKSVWVGASAGTGKTKVLIDRVLRLMLPRPGMDIRSATRPERILCLTFTKTAAAEMSNRIYRRLGEWAVMDDAALEGAVAALMSCPVTPDIVQAARRLFAQVLDTPGGLKIMTIHSFCQSVLKRFPVEAGLPPHFELMDEQSALEYLTRCQHDMITDARARPETPVAQSFAHLALHLDGGGMADLMSKIMAHRSQLAAILKKHGDAAGRADKTVAAVRARLGVPEGESEATLLQEAGRLPDDAEAGLRRVLAALLQGSKTDQAKAALMQPWLEQKDRRGALLGQYRRAFFTLGGDISKKHATKEAVKIFAEAAEVMQAEAERLAALEERLKAVRLAIINQALVTVAAEMVDRYARHKQQMDKLDFEDLIIRTCELLDEEGMVPWVLYKLDEGIDHILVDEAQDTSPYQWRVIRSLSEEFFSGRGTRDDVLRTLFVVGDEKQSIFSFQGADPGAFDSMQKFFGEKVRQVQEGWEILLEYSFRSTESVLSVVDRVFARDEARRGVVADLSRNVFHRAFRAGHAGLVELWPLVDGQPRAGAAPWTIPVEIENGDSASARLARKIADTVAGWLSSGEMLESRGRPIRAGDVLVLVQSRGAFVETVMRALKDAGVAVAGIDRMTLTEEIAVMDLVSAGNFALQIRDDLTLAIVLKSPLVNFSEDDLFTLCHGRRGTLWARLQDARPDVAQWLHGLIRAAGHATPYAFFAEIMNTPCPADHVSGRRALYARLGFDIQDALDEFLNAALRYEQSHTPSLQKFIHWFMRGESDIKREQEQHKADQVRIMTVHAAKGLQAPIVFLPDTTKILHDHNKGRMRLLWPSAQDMRVDPLAVPLWSPRKEFDARAYAEWQEMAAEKQMEEYRRLFYVALTRAEDRLYIAGHRGRSGRTKPGCWYDMAARAFPADAHSHAFLIDGTAYADRDGGFPQVLRVSAPQLVPPVVATPVAAADMSFLPLPDWALLPPGDEPAPPVPLAPSRPGEDEPAARGPLDTDMDWRFRRGLIVHHILELLPQLPEARWEKTLAAYLARPALDIPPDEQSSFAREVLTVLRHPGFAAIFGPGSRAEVPLVGLAGAGAAAAAQKILSGVIDRLLVTPDEVLVVDYKTNRPPPKDVADVPVIYLKQMAAYRAVLRRIYPGRPVRCALLWTDVTLLMPLSENMLDPYAP